MKKISTMSAGVLCSVLLFVGILFTPTTHAATFSEADIRAQTISVQTALVSTLEEHIKLLQMILIQRLEAKVAALQAQL